MATSINAKIKKGKKIWYLHVVMEGNESWMREMPEVRCPSDMYEILREELHLPAGTDRTDIVMMLFGKSWLDGKWVDDFTVLLKRRREEKGWTQAELAEKASLSIQAVSALEQGSRAPTWESVMKLANALKVSIEHFRVDPKKLKWSDDEAA